MCQLGIRRCALLTKATTGCLLLVLQLQTRSPPRLQHTGLDLQRERRDSYSKTRLVETALRTCLHSVAGLHASSMCLQNIWTAQLSPTGSLRTCCTPVQGQSGQPLQRSTAGRAAGNASCQVTLVCVTPTQAVVEVPTPTRPAQRATGQAVAMQGVAGARARGAGRQR